MIFFPAPAPRTDRDTPPPAALPLVNRRNERRKALHRPAGICSRARELGNRYAREWYSGRFEAMHHLLSAHYVFVDPLVGTFSGQGLPDYLRFLNELAGHRGQPYEGFVRLSGPTERRGAPAFTCYWREISRLGLSGVSELTIIDDRVVREIVSYDVNMATERLRAAAVDRRRFVPAARESHDERRPLTCPDQEKSLATP